MRRVHLGGVPPDSSEFGHIYRSWYAKVEEDCERMLELVTNHDLTTMM